MVRERETFGAEDKERFAMGISMMKEYYDAIENRLTGSMALFVVILGWLISSSGARGELRNHWFLVLALATLTLITAMYVWNVTHWLHRWRQIRDSLDALHYMEFHFYTRYQQIPSSTLLFYIAPIAVLYIFTLVFISLIGAGYL